MFGSVKSEAMYNKVRWTITTVCEMSNGGRGKNVWYSARNEMYAWELNNYW